MHNIEITEKQSEYLRNATHRWNMAVGAVRSGKSYLAVQYIIPFCLRERHGKKGLNLILGATKENIERNVLHPMREIWGDGLVSRINNRNIATMFGEQVYCIGAENAAQVSKIRGSEIKFCYCDEMCDINKEVFDLLKSRLSLKYSVFHGACNPAGPQHYIKQFIDSAEDAGVDLYCQKYTLYDNPFLPPEYIRSLEKEYDGTVYYRRYIEGLWSQAEGLIYPMWEKAIGEPPQNAIWREFWVSTDYGTKNATAALLWAFDGFVWYALKEYYYSGRNEKHDKTDEDLTKDMIEFVQGYENVKFIVDPSAASFKASLRRAGLSVTNARNDVLDGIRETASCMQLGYIKLSNSLENTKKELSGYCWDESKNYDAPIKENDHAVDCIRYLCATRHVVRGPSQPIEGF